MKTDTLLGLSDIRQTKVYQEAFQEGEQQGEQQGRQEAQLENIPRMATYGLSPETIAQLLDLPLETVTEVLENLDRDNQS
ncbi:hypothetical protein PMG71_15815 [Roseofilum sp. BLCC_M154]|uniref:Rpn family recombination-promoting nuclease/putative transposase n=1 Tax=Roseofilum acuticapitatum BLCC-M154 TaxID=3022444 RepID=A0ABT7AVL2_9CYAN|nr:hypothetical protein [Roseofilum acuticapitatum]MDJ1170900.1 hypothetical protein [Roseofilum acuticapitatum BLCC-M154]